jgi:hypothetical protein
MDTIISNETPRFKFDSCVYEINVDTYFKTLNNVKSRTLLDASFLLDYTQKKKKKKKRGRIGTMAGSGCTASGRRAYGGLWRLVVVVTAMAV